MELKPKVDTLKQIEKLKLFISYSHKDNLPGNPYIDQFKIHISPLKDNGLIEDWYDRKILPGEDFQNKIDNNLEDADIICLFISANFLASKACTDEKKKALKLKEKKGVKVITIILSQCGWKDVNDISKPLALPTDAKPVSSFNDRDDAWNDVYDGLKKIIEKEIKIKQLEIEEEFKDFLYNAEMLTKAHPKKENVHLDDIFIYPELDKYDSLREFDKKISSDELLKNILDYPKIVIAGENLSGKTTLCKKIFKELRNRNFVPVYVSDKNASFLGEIENKILKSLHKQYKDININEIDKERIIPIIDDFHHARNKERHIEDLAMYTYCIIIVDDIFGLNIKDEKLISSFISFRIDELKPSLRYGLAKKWISLTGNEVSDNYKDIDKRMAHIDSTLGKNFGRGIMPAYPFYILSTIITYETFMMPLDQEITSQGYCYQAFIYFYLRKNGVKNDEIDIYINFLTELSFYIYKEKKEELTPDDFTSFMKSYLDKYNLPIEYETLLKNLRPIISEDSFANYSFPYPYIYYFFVAKYFAEHTEDEKEEIKRMINNLHVDKNAYITIFITHHSKNINILKEIENEALCLFDKYKPAILTKDEVKFFDEQEDIIIKAALPPANSSPEKERMERLKIQDKLERSREDVKNREDAGDVDTFEKELRRAIKTVEVMGCIIKNRAGSLERSTLEKIFAEGMNVHLRILSCAFELIKNEAEQKAILDLILKRLRKIINKEENIESSSDDMLKIRAKIIFWNMNFLILCGIISKIVRSLGSDKLIGITNQVCDKVNTPASFLIKHGVLMGHGKNLQINDLAKKINDKNFSNVAKNTIKFMIVDHCSLHQINYRDRQRIINQLGISMRLLLRK